MKILRVIARLNVGGPARHVVLLNAGLEARGHQTLLVHGSLDEGEASLEHLAHEHAVPLVTVPELGRSVKPMSDASALLTLERIIRREQPDIIHTHTAKAGTLGRLAALAWNATRQRRRRALVVHTFHGHVFEGYFSPAVNTAIRAAERFLALATDTIVTISPRQHTDITNRFRIAPSTKTVVVPLGLDLDALLALPLEHNRSHPSFGFEHEAILVGYAGRMVPVKSLDVLLRAFARASVAVPMLRLVLAGDGPERTSLESLARELGIADRVRFIGWTGNLPRFYAELDMFALSSVNEGTPVAAIESMAAARPVISTDVGGVGDVVTHDVSGLLTPAGSVEGLANAMQRLAADADARRTMGAAGRQRAATQYSSRRLVEEIESLYVTRLARKRRD